MSESVAGREAERKRAIARVVAEVAGYLGNTPAVAGASYIDPRVIDQYEHGHTIASALSELGKAATLASSRPVTMQKAVVKLLGRHTRDRPVKAAARRHAAGPGQRRPPLDNSPVRPGCPAGRDVIRHGAATRLASRRAGWTWHMPPSSALRSVVVLLTPTAPVAVGCAAPSPDGYAADPPQARKPAGVSSTNGTRY